ncbi:NACHT domain protein [Rivularia sp. PCC 7116]|uniref:NACHT domain-containing protein n=1 Tax=Rivularia sp. PCC 7116 TaxID=373994 RepID=UPI00029ECDDF|nr:NACHT domain-containing protein [Rivularia sp. PCC 7116]AFY56538.1 NACHT domain protein [Rivularia sp. PCC 7116]
MSKNTSFFPTFSLNIVARLAIVLLCVSSSLMIGDISWGTNSCQKKDVNTLLKCLSQDDEILRDDVIELLKQIRKSENADPLLLEAALTNKKLLVRSGVKQVFENTNEEVPEHLITTLKDTKDATIRRRAIILLSQINWKMESKSDEIMKQLSQDLNKNKTDVTLLRNATYTIGKIYQELYQKNVTDENSNTDTSKIIIHLTELLKFSNPKYNNVVQNTADALGKICQYKIKNINQNKEEAQLCQDEVIQGLNHKLVDPKKNTSIFRSSANSLKLIYQKLYEPDSKKLKDKNISRVTNEIITKLSKGLYEQDAHVQGNSANALGALGIEVAKQESSVEKLTELWAGKKVEENVKRKVGSALVKIANNIEIYTRKQLFIPDDFNNSITHLKNAPDKITNDQKSYQYEELQLKHSLNKITYRQPSIIWEKIKKWNNQTNNLLLIIFILLILYPSLCSIILRFKPIWLINISEWLLSYKLSYPAILNGRAIKPGSILIFMFLFDLFRFHPRALDAWVKKYISEAKERFELWKTVEQRSTHIPVEATSHGKPVTITEILKETFESNRACLLIFGEGGTGKTSLACQVARWVMSGDCEKSPSKHLMLPVLIERDLQSSLLEAVEGTLKNLIDYGNRTISQELLEKLLEKQRILVIVDNFSGMSQNTRDLINPGIGSFCINALILTSRLDEEEKLGNITKTKLNPKPIQVNSLSSFMHSYLLHRGKVDNLSDIEFFDACKQISKMVGTRDINVLLVKLFADLIENKIENRRDLPNNIPDLMLQYLNQINQDVTRDKKVDDRKVHKDAKILAWECCRQTVKPFRPIPITIEDTLKALGGDDAENRLKYLKDLDIIQFIGAAQDQIGFVLDPLAEYLACLHLLKINGNNQELWHNLLQKLQQAADTEDAPESIQGFLLALRDCYFAKGKQANIPETIAKKLENLPKIGNG